MDKSQTEDTSTRFAAGPDSNALGGALYFPFSTVAAQAAPLRSEPTDDGIGYTPYLGIAGLAILAIVAWKLLSR